MTSARCIRIYARNVSAGRISAIWAVAAMAWAMHLSGPLLAQNFQPCPPNICASSTGASVGVGTMAPVQKLHTEGSIAIAASYQSMGSGNARYIGIPGVNGAFDQSAGAFLIFNQGLGNGLSNWIDFVTHNSGLSVGIRMTIAPNGNVGIGTTTPQYPLTIKGTIGAREVIVTSTMGADYVFKPEYHLRQLKEVSAYIKEHHHLPEIPSETDVQANGVSLGEMQMKLLAKIEELTLHAIQADERNNRLEQQNRELLARMARLEARNSSESGAKE